MGRAPTFFLENQEVMRSDLSNPPANGAEYTRLATLLQINYTHRKANPISRQDGGFSGGSKGRMRSSSAFSFMRKPNGRPTGTEFTCMTIA